MSRVIRKPTLSMYKKYDDADQLRSNCATFRSASLVFFSRNNELGLIDPIIRLFYSDPEWKNDKSNFSN